jgi:hypothetical protein
VNQVELITNATQHMTKTTSGKVLKSVDLSDLFGIDIVDSKPKRKNR